VTPTLLGRLQTRVFAVAIIGALWTLILTPFLPIDADLSAKYKATFAVLFVVGAVGLLWEFVYHFLQQFRWEKDWVAFFGLLTGISEGIVTWLIVSAGWAPGSPKVGGLPFVIQFVTTWLVIWLWINGPMRVPFLRWRFRGGRLI